MSTDAPALSTPSPGAPPEASPAATAQLSTGSPMPPAAGLPSGVDHLVLFDGTCGFCDASVQWLLDHDGHRRFHFAPLQGTTAAALRVRHPDLPADLDSVLLVSRTATGEDVHARSDAVLGICRQLPGAWSWLGVFSLVPRGLRDLAYMLIARVRYRLWGRVDACRLPAPEEAHRFLP